MFYPNSLVFGSSNDWFELYVTRRCWDHKKKNEMVKNGREGGGSKFGGWGVMGCHSFFNFSFKIINKLKAKKGPLKCQKCQLYLPILCCTLCICPYLKLIKKRLSEQTAASVITKKIENDICGNYLICPWNSFSSARKRAFTYIHTLCYQCCSNKLLPNSFSSLRPPIFSPKFVPLWMLSICWWWSWSGEALLFLFNLFFLELISNICPNWCWVFVGHDLGQVQPLIFWNKICLQLMLNICSNWCWVLLVVILVRCSPFSFQHDFFMNQLQVFVPTDVEYLLVVVLVKCSSLFLQ